MKNQQATWKGIQYKWGWGYEVVSFKIIKNWILFYLNNDHCVHSHLGHAGLGPLEGESISH